jgi:hypothetical protein
LNGYEDIFTELFLIQLKTKIEYNGDPEIMLMEAMPIDEFYLFLYRFRFYALSPFQKQPENYGSYKQFLGLVGRGTYIHGRTNHRRKHRIRTEDRSVPNSEDISFLRPYYRCDNP